MGAYAPKKKRARKKKPARKKKLSLARKAAKRLTATKVRTPKKKARSRVVKPKNRARPAAKPRAKRAAHGKGRHAATKARERKNEARRKARAQAKRQEKARLAKLERQRQKRNAARRAARARVRRVNQKHVKLRSEKEKLRLKTPKTTRTKVRKVRKEVDSAISAPPKEPSVVETMQAKFDKLLEEAKKKKELPKVDYRKRTIDSDRRRGRKQSLRIEMLVDEGSIEEILYRVKQAIQKLAKYNYKLWMITTIMSSFGSGLVGSGGRVMRSDDPLAFKFQTETYDSTGMFSRAFGAVERLEGMLEQWASDGHPLVYLHALTIHHFTFVSRS